MIHLVDVSRSFGGPAAVTGASFELARGERLALQGPSGNGKTTLLRLIAGLELPDAGEIYLDGKLASKPGFCLPPYRRGIGFAFQSPTLWPHMTVNENLLFTLNGGPRPQKSALIHELAEAFEFSNLLKRMPGQLSGGEARRVGLARALVSRPPILLLDEPLTHLDADLKGRVMAAALAFIDGFSPTVIFVTHEAAEAAALGGRTLRVEKGRVSQP